MQKIKVIIFVCLITSFSFGQSSNTVKLIDSLINEDFSRVHLISNIIITAKIDSMDDHPLFDELCQVIKYREKRIPIEFQEVWITHSDTGQVNCYYFHNNELVKISTRVFQNKKLIYYQNFYLDKKIVISGLDSEGKVLDPRTHLINGSKLLRKIKKHKEKILFSYL
jgi:hypothetical protein